MTRHDFLGLFAVLGAALAALFRLGAEARVRRIRIHWWSAAHRGAIMTSGPLPTGGEPYRGWKRLESTVPHPDDDPEGYELAVRVKSGGYVDPWGGDWMDDMTSGELTDRWFHNPGPFRSWLVRPSPLDQLEPGTIYAEYEYTDGVLEARTRVAGRPLQGITPRPGG